MVVSRRPLAQLLSLVLRDVLDDLHDQLAAEGFADLRPAYGYALNSIRSGRMTAVQLADELGMTKQGAAKVLEALESEGYVQRVAHPGDGRAKLVELTGRGVRLLEASELAQQRIEARWAEIVGARPARALRNSLEEIVRASDAPPRLRPPW